MRLSKEELSRLYREQTRRAAGNHDGCLSSETLLRAFAGEISDPERERVAEHLSMCSDCAAEYRLIISLRSWTPQNVAAGANPEPQRALRAETTRGWFPAMRGVTAAVYALAASLLIVTVALGSWVLSLHRESRLLVAQIDARDRTNSEAARRLSESASQIAQLRREMDALSQVQINAPIIDLDPRDSVRAASTQTSRTVLIPAKTNVFTLVLNVGGEPSFPDYSLEILGPSGASVWSGRGLQKSAFDTFTVAVPRSLVTGGQYQFALYGLRGNKKELIENYRVTIQYR
jgi:Putative zinc-finger